MIAARFICVCAAATLITWGLWPPDAGAPSPSRGKSQIAKPNPAAVPEIRTHSAPAKTQECVERSFGLKGVQPHRRNANEIAELEKARIDAFTRPQHTEHQAATGSSAAAQALFEMLSSCYPETVLNNSTGHGFSIDGCPAVPTELARHRWHILAKAAVSGSPAAQVLYAENALAQARLMELRGVMNDEQALTVQKLKKESEQYAIQAAHAGSTEAAKLLAQAYMSAMYGSPDKYRAYVYFFWLYRYSPEPGIEQALATLAKSMAAADIQDAKSQIFGCGE